MTNNIIAGIDEAGRGPVIGPLVIAGVSITEENIDRLNSMGLKDSKLLTPKKREQLAKDIEKIAKDIIVLKVSSCKIDNMRKSGVNLNKIEAMKMADTISLLSPNKVYIDCPDVNPERFTMIIKKMVQDSEIIAEHKADYKYPIVSAASIIAKVTRDKEIKKLHEEYGDFGPGYPSNEKTMSWLRNWLNNNKDYPDIVRRSWETAKSIKAEKSQKGISGFFQKLKKEETCKKK